MATDCTYDNYRDAYRYFVSEFVDKMNPRDQQDQLPVAVSAYDLTENETVGEIINVTLQYLNQTHCPPSLQGHLIHEVVQEMKAMCKKQPEDCGLKPQEKTYAPPKLMKAVRNKINEICKCYLEQNKLESLPPPPSIPLPVVGVQAIRNCRRKMEDKYAILHDLNTIFSIQSDTVANYYAVFDGHGGEDAAVYCAAHLHRSLVESEYYPSDPERALRDAFLTTDAQFTEKSKTHNACGGTTAVCTLLLNRNLYVAWVGDSEAILVRDGRITSLVNPHRLSRLDEWQRIYSMGGYITHSTGVMRVNGMLNVSRAIGDLRHKPYVTAEPETKCVPLNGTEDFMIIASDGLWDSLLNTAAASIVYREIYRNPNTLKYALQRLLDCARQIGSADNITVIVVLLAPINEIAARAQKAYKYLTQKTASQTQLKNEDPKGPLPSNANHRHDGTNGVFIKQIPQLLRGQEQQEQEQHGNGAAEQMDGNHTMYETSSNGEHENGDVDCDYSDLGPETDVDAIDDVAPVPVKNLYYEFLPDDADGAGRKNEQLNKDERADTPDSNEVDADSDVPLNHETERKLDRKLDHNLDRKLEHNLDRNMDHGVDYNVDNKIDHNVDLNVDHKVDHRLEDSVDQDEDHDVDHSSDNSEDQSEEHSEVHSEVRSEIHEDEHNLDDDLVHHLEHNLDHGKDADEPYIDNNLHADVGKNDVDDVVDVDDRVSLKDEAHVVEEPADVQLEGTHMGGTQVSTDVQLDDTRDVVDDAVPLDYDESPPSPQATKPLQHALISEADNVADSEDSEDEWNYYRIDPNKEKVSAAPAEDEPQDNQTENEAHCPEAQTEEDHHLEQPKPPQVEQEIKCESPKEVSSELIDTEISAEDKLVEPRAEEASVEQKEEEEESADMAFRLNPNAAEFVPVSPQVMGPKLNLAEDFPISGSPLKQMSPMDDIQVPSQSEFDEEVCRRPREMETEEKDCTNGDYLQRTDYKDFMADRLKGAGIPTSLDDSEISSTKAEFGDESASFITATEFHRTGISTVDESFSSTERDYDIAKDPMAMSFTPSDFEAAFDKGVDLNAVHDLSTVDLDDKNGTVEDAKNDSVEEENNDTMEGEYVMVPDSPETEPELATLTSEPKQPESEPEPEQPALTAASFTCAFTPVMQDEIQTQAEAPNSTHASSFQEYDETEATFIEHPDEPKKTESSDVPTEEHALIEPVEQQEIVKSEPSPLTENYSAEFGSEKELVSVENEQPLSTCSADIDETKPIDEPSEDAILLTSESQKDLCVKESDTPLSVSPVPDTMECISSQLKDEVLSSPMEDVHIAPTPSAFTLQSDVLEFTPSQCTMGTLVPEPAFTTATTAPEVLSNPFEDQHEEEKQLPIEEKIEDFSKAISVTEPVQQESAQDILLDFSMDQDMCTKGPVEPVAGETTPPPTPLEPTDKISHHFDELICPIQSSTMLEDTIVAKFEEPIEKVEVCEIEVAKEVPLIEAREPEVVQATPALNLSESMQEFTGLEKQLLPEQAAPVQYVIPEAEPQAIKEEAVEQKELVEPTIKETTDVQDEKIVSEITPQVTSEDKQPIEQAVEATEKKIEEPTIAPVAVVAAAAATVTAVAATAAVAAQSKTKAKLVGKTTKTTPTSKTTPKSTPTSPSKTLIGASRTSTLSAKKQTTTTGAARPKDLDASKKTSLSSTATKTAASKPATAPKTTAATTKTATRTSITAPKPKSTTASPKPNLSASDKKPTANGDVKSLSKPAAAKSLNKPTTGSSTTRTSLVKTSTSTTARTSAGGATTAKSRPTSAVTSTAKTTTKSSTATTTTASATGAMRPKTAPVTSTTAKPRVSTTAKSPMIDKQIKETANKQISLARTSTSSASKTTRTSVSSTSASTTMKRTSTSSKTTNVTSSTAKKGTAVSKVTPKNATAIKSTSSSVNAKVVQNGVSESMQINNTIITTTNSKLEDDVPKKDLSPVIAPTDNQLIMSSD